MLQEKYHQHFVTIVTALICQSVPAFAREKNDNMERVPKEMLEKPVFERERERESMRDKSHDYRLRVGNDTSIGVGGDGINLRKVFLLNAQF